MDFCSWDTPMNSKDAKEIFSTEGLITFEKHIEEVNKLKKEIKDLKKENKMLIEEIEEIIF